MKEWIEELKTMLCEVYYDAHTLTENEGRKLIAEIGRLEAENERLLGKYEESLDYSITLQRLIDNYCASRVISQEAADRTPYHTKLLQNTSTKMLALQKVCESAKMFVDNYWCFHDDDKVFIEALDQALQALEETKKGEKR